MPSNWISAMGCSGSCGCCGWRGGCRDGGVEAARDALPPGVEEQGLRDDLDAFWGVRGEVDLQVLPGPRGAARRRVAAPRRAGAVARARARDRVQRRLDPEHP